MAVFIKQMRCYPACSSIYSQAPEAKQLWNTYFMELNGTLMECSCLSEDRRHSGHFIPHAYVEIKWICEGICVDSLKVTSAGCWWVCLHPSEPGWWTQSVSLHLHTARVVPAHSLIKEDEKHGAGPFRVSREVEVLSVTKAPCSAQAFLQYHLYICVNSSMQAYVFMVCILHLRLICFFKHQV